MIVSIVIVLKKMDADVIFHKIYPAFIHGWIYSKIRQTEVGQYYHETNKAPFALKNALPDKQGGLALHLVFFDYRVILEFYRSIIGGEQIRLGSHFYLLEHCAIHPEEHPNAGMISYDSFHQLPILEKMMMIFKHTAFNHDHKTVVLPIPENIVGSILRKWNLTSGQPVASENETEWVHKLAAGLLITSHNIGTTLYYIRSNIKLTTFSGRVVIENSHHDPALKRLLNTLLHFSHYSGIGWKCSYGMGSVEIKPLTEKQEDSVLLERRHTPFEHKPQSGLSFAD